MTETQNFFSNPQPWNFSPLAPSQISLPNGLKSKRILNWISSINDISKIRFIGWEDFLWQFHSWGFSPGLLSKAAFYFHPSSSFSPSAKFHLISSIFAHCFESVDLCINKILKFKFCGSERQGRRYRTSFYPLTFTRDVAFLWHANFLRRPECQCKNNLRLLRVLGIFAVTQEDLSISIDVSNGEEKEKCNYTTKIIVPRNDAVVLGTEKIFTFFTFSLPFS